MIKFTHYKEAYITRISFVTHMLIMQVDWLYKSFIIPCSLLAYLTKVSNDDSKFAYRLLPQIYELHVRVLEMVYTPNTIVQFIIKGNQKKNCQLIEYFTAILCCIIYRHNFFANTTKLNTTTRRLDSITE